MHRWPKGQVGSGWGGGGGLKIEENAICGVLRGCLNHGKPNFGRCENRGTIRCGCAWVFKHSCYKKRRRSGARFRIQVSLIKASGSDSQVSIILSELN